MDQSNQITKMKPLVKFNMQELNEFFAHGLKMLDQLEKSSSPHAEQNAEIMRQSIGDAWIKCAEMMTMVSIDDQD